MGSNTICCIPADNNGNKLWIKDFMENEGRFFIKYKSTYNDIPFIKTEIYLVDEGKNFAITGNDGTVLWRFSINWISKNLI